jgi:hypothetical protein
VAEFGELSSEKPWKVAKSVKEDLVYRYAYTKAC